MTDEPNSPNAQGLPGTGFQFDAFISYRRSDGRKLARRLRRMLLDYELPHSLTKRSARRKLAIYLDTIYEQANEDFFDRTILPALRASRQLIVVHTPDALKARENGNTNWLVREVEFFRTLPQGRNISVALAKGDASELPANLHIDFPNIEIVDLRGLSVWSGRGIKDRLLVFIAALHNIPPESMPDLHQEEKRRDQHRRRVFIRSSIAASLAITSLFGWLTYQHRWSPVTSKSHWVDNDHGRVKIELIEGGRSVLTVGAVDGPYAHLWDAAAGQISFTVKGKELTLLPERRFLLVANPERRIYAVDLTTGQIHRTPLVPPATNAIEQAPWMLDYGSSGTILLQVGAVEGPSSPDSLPSIVVWSLDSGKIGRVDRFLSGGDWQFEVSQDGSRLIANQFEPGNFQPKLWDVKTGAPIASLITAGKNTEKDFRINERFSLIVTRSPLDDEGTTQQFALWELADGAPTGKSAIHDMGDLPVSPTLKMDLSRNGNWVFRGGGREAFEPIELVDGRTLKALADLKGGARGWWLDEGLFLLEEAGHASMWDIETERRIGLQGIDTRRITSAAVSGDRTGAVLVSTDGSASLWDLQRGSKVRELPLPSRPRRVQRSLDGRFILVTLASGQVQVLSFQYGERIAELNDAGFENDWEAYVDMACKRINVWTIDGRVLQYREQLYMFGRPWIVDESCP